MAFCEDCGAPLSPGVLFCENCGAKISNPEVSDFSSESKEVWETGIIYTNLSLLEKNSEKSKSKQQYGNSRRQENYFLHGGCLKDYPTESEAGT